LFDHGCPLFPFSDALFEFRPTPMPTERFPFTAMRLKARFNQSRCGWLGSSAIRNGAKTSERESAVKGIVVRDAVKQ
jgi:hypothetical protein